jgi:hypothetical protein
MLPDQYKKQIFQYCFQNMFFQDREAYTENDTITLNMNVFRPGPRGHGIQKIKIEIYQKVNDWNYLMLLLWDFEYYGTEKKFEF